MLRESHRYAEVEPSSARLRLSTERIGGSATPKYPTGGVYIQGLDFLVAVICFSVLAYGLCYMNLSCNYKIKKQI